MPKVSTRNNKVRDEKRNTCFTNCVAYIMKRHSSRVPFFIGYDDWIVRAMLYLEKYGYSSNLYANPIGKKAFKFSKQKLYIVMGVSPRSKSKSQKRAKLWHAVIYKGDKPFWDPIGTNGLFIKGRPMFILDISKKRKI